MTERVTFPTLPDSDIVSCLKDLGVQQITETDLKKPEFEFTHVLYENIVQKLMGYSDDEMAKPVYQIFNQFEHKQLYENAVYEITFLNNLFRLMHIISVDFRLNDLLNPTYQRLRRVLSGIINFARYREDKYVKFLTLDEEASKYSEELISAERLNELAQDELSRIREEIKSEEPLANELLSKRAKLIKLLQSLNQHQIIASETRANLKAKKHELNESINAMTKKRKALQEKKQSISLRILQDPVKAVQVIEEMKNTKTRELKALSDAESKRNESTVRLTLIEENREALDESVQILQQIKAELDRMKQLKLKIKEHQSNILHNQEVHRELNLNRQQVEQELQMCRERVAKLGKENFSAKSFNKNILEQEKERMQKLEQENSVMIGKLKALDTEIAKLKVEENKVIREGQEKIECYKQQMSRMMDTVRRYHKNLYEAMKTSMQQQIEFQVQVCS